MPDATGPPAHHEHILDGIAFKAFYQNALTDHSGRASNNDA
jgi:hypothetical protein